MNILKARIHRSANTYLHGFVGFLSVTLNSIDPCLQCGFFDGLFAMNLLFEISTKINPVLTQASMLLTVDID